MKRYYFDHAAATPMDPEVEKAMKPYWSAVAGNPGSLHWFGQEASAAVFAARETIAKSLGCHYSEIIFTGSATEANNLALRGAIKAARVVGMQKPKIITSVIEHDSVLDTCKDLEKEGVEVIYLPVSKNGIVDPNTVKAALDDRTILVSIMYANNEIGTIQPISEIGKIISDFRKRMANSKWQMANGKKAISHQPSAISHLPLFHTDAVQAFNYLECNVDALGVDLLTLSAQKIYGPKGVGALYMRRQMANSGSQIAGYKKSIRYQPFAISPIITGGGQEQGFRSGTENVPGIIGFAAAVKRTDALREKETRRLRALQTYFLEKLHAFDPAITLNGDREKRIPNNLSLDIPPSSDGKGSAQDLVIALDLAGFAVSPGSACAARTCAPSHVLRAIGRSPIRAMSGIRITMGRQTNKPAVDTLLRTLRKILKH